MATTTPNFGWPVPTSTDLVKDGATAMEALGDAIDTSMVDLKGGTTGQVLAKASNTDMDFSWVAQDDSNAIQNTIVDAKGDLIAASAADTPARLAVGSNGESLVADSSTSTGLRYQANFAAGKNKIINGDFSINQRNFTSSTTGDTYSFDRFIQYQNGGTTYSAQTFTPGAAPVAGYEAKNYARIVTTGSSTYALYAQLIEDVRTLAGQTATISFWAKAASGTPSITAALNQNFGSGGSASVTNIGTKQTISTSWTRYSWTISVPSISGKTIGTSSYLSAVIYVCDSVLGSGVGNQVGTFDIWGVQVEAGSVATAFQTATGTLQGELAACQRYYQQYAGGLGVPYNGVANSATTLMTYLAIQPTMRTAATCTVGGTLYADDGYAGTVNAASPTVDYVDQYQGGGRFRIGGFSGMTTGRHYSFYYNTGYIGLSAEL